MKNSVFGREEAFQLLKEYNSSESLIKHALAVESVMKHFAEIMEPEQVEKWAIVGLLHDIDYEKFPEQHCIKAREILLEKGVPEQYIRAVESHGWKICTQVEPMEPVEKVLYTIDELTGLVAATALMRPSKSVLDLETKSVKKKWSTKGFAAGVNREVIQEGATMLNMDINEVIEQTINGMKKAADAIGLRGEL